MLFWEWVEGGGGGGGGGGLLGGSGEVVKLLQT